ncbi:MAG: class I SAM-dependent rRNA methyltransferase [Polyangiaceae bacterium]|nr:class I SAM-dependent rRNA methyltransferase [Polyangiaceae bacterium]
MTLKPGHVQPVWAGHPWVYAQAVARIEGGAVAGDEVEVLDPEGRFLGRGLYSPRSAILVRLFSRSRGTAFDARLLEERLRAALARREVLSIPSEETTGYRLVNGEGDDLPGLIVDRYDTTIAVQLNTIGLKLREALVLDVLGRVTGARSMVDRSSRAAAELEGFNATQALLRGDAVATLSFRERGLSYRIPCELTQKTGYYFDQRPLRSRIEQLARGRRVLDTYCYVGSSAMSAARGGAQEVVAVDSNAEALRVGAECAQLNGLAGAIRYERASASEVLKTAGRRGGYDLVICDPPKLSPTRTAKQRALGAMRRLAAAASRATVPGGLLALSSCSAAVSFGELTRALALGATDVGLRPVVLERLFQGPDHPVPAAFAEGLYLSTLLAEIRPA